MKSDCDACQRIWTLNHTEHLPSKDVGQEHMSTMDLIFRH